MPRRTPSWETRPQSYHDTVLQFKSTASKRNIQQMIVKEPSELGSAPIVCCLKVHW
jgi:hypothetical protein